ncbi:MAG: glycine oxidase ThiO [Candidatus Dormibacteria bacterium]
MSATPTSQDRTQCLVVGAGVVGLAVAWELAKLDLAVTVLERQPECGSGAAAAAAGMLAAGVEAGAPGPFLDLCRLSSKMWRDWAEQLFQDSGVDCELQTSGLLRVTSSAESISDLEVRRAWQLTQGIEVSQLLTLDQLRQEVAGVSGTVVAGLLYPDEAHVHSHRVTQALELAARRLGVRIETGVEVAAVTVDRDRVRARTPGQDFEADFAVIAAGSWSGGLLAELGVRIGVDPIRGQIAAVRLPPGRLPRIVFGDRGYVLQKRGGLVLIGATEEVAGFDSWVTLAGLERLSQIASNLLPAAGEAAVAHSWAGLRPQSAGGPLLGRVPASDRVLVATGHHRNGVLLAPASAALLGRALLAGADSAELAPFSPRRVAAG